MQLLPPHNALLSLNEKSGENEGFEFVSPTNKNKLQ